jgi:hypothetical protein
LIQHPEVCSVTNDVKQSLELKFPEMKTTSSAPLMVTLNGCGLSVFGRRGYDEETDSFVKTYCLCFLFLPIFCLGAYRVVKAGFGTWCFVGRVPLGPLALAWNIFFAAGILILIGSLIYFS